MDHIPLPQAPALNHIEIPLYERTDAPYRYSQPWFSYPARCGFDDIAKQRFYDLHEYPQDLRSNLVAFVQSWLFFGVLEEFLGIKQDPTEWVDTTEEGQRVVRVSQLCEKLDAWRTKITQLDGDQQLEVRTGIDQILRHMHFMHSDLGETTADLIQAVQAGTGAYHSDLLPDELNLSLDVLHHTLSLARNFVFQDVPLSTSVYSKSRLVYVQLLQNGWDGVQARYHA